MRDEKDVEKLGKKRLEILKKLSKIKAEYSAVCKQIEALNKNDRNLTHYETKEVN